MHVAIRILALITLALPLLAHSHPDEQTADNTVTPAELANLIRSGATVHVYDANGRDSYLEGHVPGAQWVDYDAVALDDMPAALDAPLVFYCYNPMCGASHTAAEMARSFGYRNVRRMPEGIVGWHAAGMPVVTGAGTGTPGAWEASHVGP